MSCVSSLPPSSAARRSWHPRHWLASPARLGFVAGALVLALGALGWAARLWWPGPAGRVPLGAAHALWAAWGFMPLFVAGFLCTAGARWVQAPPVKAAALLPAVGAQLAGWLVFGLALADGGAQAPLMAGMGLACVAAGWSGAVLRLWRLLRAGAARGAQDRLHLRLALAGCAWSALLLDVAAGAVAAEAWTLARALAHVALWGAFGVVYAAALHRLVPFMGDAAPQLDARWPAWLLWSLAGVMALQGVLRAVALLLGPLPGVLDATASLAPGGAGVLLLGLWTRWRRLPAVRQRLPAMLLRGVFWLAVALLLSALGAADAALHAYTLGFLGTLLLAMASRVACAQIGRAVVVDGVLWALFHLLQAAVLARVAWGLWPAGATWLLPVAAGAWALVSLVWLLRYGWWLGRAARETGRPGAGL
ncbi:NnrS family protein [Azohydromonas lata]|uniref:NnrS family protein n=1 Tax=Azohydromonas lata TaxID=45677 RepID=UPI0012F504F3|nr:NnrS family protein [Azohydromonas lata]